MSRILLALALGLALGGPPLQWAAGLFEAAGSQWDPNGAAGTDAGGRWDPNGAAGTDAGGQWDPDG